MKIVVLGGGLNTERAVSLVSATSICKALRSLGHKAIFVDTFMGLENYTGDLEAIFDEPDGCCTDVDIQASVPDLELIKQSRKDQSPARLGKNVLEVCRLADCVYLGLHGADGEDGKIQAMLELLGVPYTGSGPLGSAMAMDKAIAKKMMKAAGVQTPAWTEHAINEENVEILCEQIIAPCVIKVINGGSSIGVCIAHTQGEVEKSLREVAKYGTKIIVEELVCGREFTVPVIDGRALVPIEIIPPDNGTFDYVAKYQSGAVAAREICPAPIEDTLKERLQRVAEQVHEALSLSVISRSDYIVDDEGEIWCLEVNTLPGMTSSSLIPKAAKYEGIEYAALCEKIIDISMKIKR